MGKSFLQNTHSSSSLFVSQTVKVLLKFDADPNLANDKGTTSIDICKDDKILKLLTTTEVKADIEKSHAVAKEKEDGGEAEREEEVEKCHDDGIKTGAASFPPPSSPKTETDVSDMDTEQASHKAKLDVAAMLSPPTSGPMSLENVPPSAGASDTAVGRKRGRGRFRGRRTKGGFYSDISSSESESDYFEVGSKRRRRKGLLVERQTQRSLAGVSESQEETDEEVEMRTGVDEEGKGKEGRDKAEKSEEIEGVDMVAEEAGKVDQESIMTEKNKDKKEEKKDVKEEEGEKEEKKSEKDEEKKSEEKSEKDEEKKSEEKEGEKDEKEGEKDEEKKSEKDVEKEGGKDEEKEDEKKEDEEKEGEKDEEKEDEKEEEKKDVNDEETLDEHHEIGTVKSDSGQELKKGPDKMKEMEGSSVCKLFSLCVNNCVCIIIVLLWLCTQVLFQRGETMGSC